MIKISMLFWSFFLFADSILAQSDSTLCPCDTTKAEIKLCSDSIRCCITEMEKTLISELPPESELVSNHTYRRYFSRDMAKVLSLDNAVNSINRYAALSIDEDKSTFSFSPYVARLHGCEHPGQVQRVTHGYLNTFFKGKVNSDGFAELAKGGKWNKEFTGGFSLVFWLGSGGGDWFRRGGKRHCDSIKIWNFRSIQHALPAELCRKYRKIIDDASTGDVDAYVSNLGLFDGCDSLQIAMRKEYSDIEEKLAEPFWTGRWRWWISLSPEYGYKGIALLDTVKQAGGKDTSFGTGSLKSSVNLLVQFKHLFGKPSFYLSPSITFTRRNMFSDMTTQSWNKIRQERDTSFLVTDNKDVYLYSGGNIDHKFLPTYAVQTVGIWNWDKFGIGYDIFFSYDKLFPIAGVENGKSTERYGLVIPFNDKTGERVINLTLFYQHSRFKIVSMDDVEIVGIRFAVPIFSTEDK